MFIQSKLNYSVLLYMHVIPPPLHTHTLTHSQVRAAAVYALGTYIFNKSEDGASDLATQINHNVCMTILTLITDGSPIVRRVSHGGRLGD